MNEQEKQITLTNEDVIVLRRVLYAKLKNSIGYDAEYNLLRQLDSAIDRIILNTK
jgi:hypothetical protein